MRILFSEAPPDYAGYVFPYAVWGFLEESETPADALDRGFLPSLPDLSRFYLCRQVRVRLAEFQPDSENRRILRKGESIRCEILPRDSFDWTSSLAAFCLDYAGRRWSTPPTPERIERIFTSPITTHVARFLDSEGRVVGLVSLLRDKETWFYSNAFYDAGHPVRSLGAFLMTETVRRLAEAGAHHLHLGTCYSRSALYKTGFPGIEFFNGNRWSGDLQELKHLIERQEKETPGHLLESPEYLARWLPDGPAALATSDGIRCAP